MNISEKLTKIIDELKTSKPFVENLPKEELQRVTFVSLTQAFAELQLLAMRIEDLEARVEKIVTQKSEKKDKWKLQD